MRIENETTIDEETRRVSSKHQDNKRILIYNQMVNKEVKLKLTYLRDNRSIKVRMSIVDIDSKCLNSNPSNEPSKKIILANQSNLSLNCPLAKFTARIWSRLLQLQEDHLKDTKQT